MPIEGIKLNPMYPWMTKEEYGYRKQREVNLKRLERETMTRRELELRYEQLIRRQNPNLAAFQSESRNLLDEAMRHLNGQKVSIDIETNYIKQTGDIEMAANPKNKFYVGRPTLLSSNDSGYCKATEKEAIEHARELVESTGVTQVVVKMVAIVERQKPPVKVTKVK